MTTFDHLVERTKQHLLGFTANQESVSELAEAITAEAPTFTVDASTVENLSRGTVEIDDELLLIKRFDRTSGEALLMGGVRGRGHQGSTAAAHEQGSLVTASPAFPRVRIKEALNDTVRGLYPSLVAFGSHEFTRVSIQFEYELPEDVSDVWYVTGETTGPTRVWRPLPNWRFNPDASPEDFPSGKSLQQLDPVTPGETVRVIYAKHPGTMAAGDDDFTAATGYPDRITDLVVYGALMRLLPALVGARLQMQAIESSERAQLVNDTSPAKAVQLFSALYGQRLEEERARQFNDKPTYAHFQGS